MKVYCMRLEMPCETSGFASLLRGVMVKSQRELVSTALLSGGGKGREILPSLSKDFAQFLKLLFLLERV